MDAGQPPQLLAQSAPHRHDTGRLIALEGPDKVEQILERVSRRVAAALAALLVAGCAPLTERVVLSFDER